jgi:uncharacterized protein YjbI with pentapeptide repeats
LSKAVLDHTTLRDADLTMADLRFVDLTGAIGISEAILDGAQPLGVKGTKRVP